MDRQRGPAQDIKVGDLTPRSKDFNVKAKVLAIGETREIPSKFGGETRRVAEATIGDETGNVVLSLWNEQIDQVDEGDSILVENGYVTLLRGHIRLNVGKYGKFDKIEDEIEASEDNPNVSDQEHEDTRPRGGGRGGFGGGRGGGYGGGGRGGGGGYGGERRGPPRGFRY